MTLTSGQPASPASGGRNSASGKKAKDKTPKSDKKAEEGKRRHGRQGCFPAGRRLALGSVHMHIKLK